MVATWFRVACHETLIQNSQIAERTTLYFFAFRLRKSPLKYNSTNNSKKIYTNNTDNNNNKIEPFHTKHAANSALHLKRNKNIQKYMFKMFKILRAQWHASSIRTGGSLMLFWGWKQIQNWRVFNGEIVTTVSSNTEGTLNGPLIT